MKKITLTFKGNFPHKFTISNFAPLHGLYVEDKNEQDTLIAIAAAPEMLEALQTVRNAYPNMITEIMSVVKSAIAKATGK